MRPSKPLRRFLGDFRGVAAVEFALLMPLLLVVLGTVTEVGRILIAQRQFENAVVSISRLIARYPEYEIRAREFSPFVLDAVFPQGASQFNLSVDSLHKTDGRLQEVFRRHVLFGTDPGQPWDTNLDQTDFVDDEAVIYVAASYRHRPLFSMIYDFDITFEKTHVLLPFFSRSYPWNDGRVPANTYVY